MLCLGVAMVFAICVIDTIQTIPRIARMLPECHYAPMVLLCHR